MKQEVMKWLRCPSCHAHDLDLTVFETAGDPSVVSAGVLICEACRTSYKIEDQVAEVIVRDPAWFTVDDHFTRRFGAELKELDLPGATLDSQKAVDEHKKSQAEIFDEIVKVYEGMTESHFWRAVDKYVWGIWGSELQQHSMVLEVGCGNGRISRPLATGRTVVVGVDISRGMLRKAIQEARKHDTDTLFYVMGDAENLPFRDGIFNGCIIYGVLHHLGSPPDCLKEVSRVMEPGGQFYALENNRSIFRSLFDLLVKLKKLWEEHPSEHYIMGSDEVKSWGRDANMRIQTRTMIYLPPHFTNPLGARGAEIAIRVSEKVLGSLPFLKDHGGLLFIRGTRLE
jgi:ubiquinone/menaquinone biosynthesis C-methylase UbiE/uncharacterized protein YbaR (Trm112 family)